MNTRIQMQRLTSLLIVLLLFVGIPNSVFAEKREETKGLAQLTEMEERELLNNNAVEKIQEFIQQRIDKNVFSTLYIDRQHREDGIIILAFTEMISEGLQNEIRSLIEEPVKVDFRLVNYSEAELVKKQQEIDQDLFSENKYIDKGFTVQHTSVNVFLNKVEIGILPFTEENSQFLYSIYGEEMVEVVEGFEVNLLIAMDEVATDTDFADEAIVEGNQQGNILSKFLYSISNWFRNLF